jgi:hypothetical protein
MKNIFKLIFGAACICFIYAACSKVGNLPTTTFANGTAPVLTSSSSAIAPLEADSNNVAVTFSWTNPKYATDSATEQYILEIDSSGRSFSKEATVVITGALKAALTAKQLNNILLGFGFAYNTPYKVDVRVTSSYGNNNEQLKSNVLTLGVTPYAVPPAVTPPPAKTLYIVGSATAGGWGNPVPLPAQQFTELDSVTYQGTFYLNGGQQYLLLPINGDWSHKYAVANGNLAGLSAGGSFGEDLSSNFPGPAATGMYQITVDFQHGVFTVKQVSQFGLLYVPGDYQGWAPATAPTLGAPKNDGNFDGFINIPSDGTYQLKFTTTPDWSNALGDGGNGTLSPSGGNVQLPGPGYYHFTANTVANTWSATATTWSMIGSFAASGWSNDVPMTYNSGSNSWTGTITTATGDQFKFRANDNWNLNYGDNGGGSLVSGGNNIGDGQHSVAITPGTHTITLFLGGAGYYTYMIQ